jgi:uncharacterized membrane protein (DUF2068 family)
MLRTIAVFKFLKAILLTATGIGALRLVHTDILGYAAYLVGKYHLNPGNRLVAQALARTANVTPRRLHELGIVAFVYAALFFAEGIGLWSLQRWGEWLTVVITGSLLPFEIYELWHRPTLPRTAILAINVAVLWYLVRRIRKG